MVAITTVAFVDGLHILTMPLRSAQNTRPSLATASSIGSTMVSVALPSTTASSSRTTLRKADSGGNQRASGLTPPPLPVVGVWVAWPRARFMASMKPVENVGNRMRRMDYTGRRFNQSKFPSKQR